MINQTIKILIVDDSSVDRKTWEQFLIKDRLNAYVFSHAETAEEALTLLIGLRPDCILLDHHLPDGDGIDLLAKLIFKFANQPVPVVMLSGVGNESVAVRALQTGAQDYVVKGSVTASGLQRAVANAIERLALIREVSAQKEKLVLANASLLQTQADLENTVVQRTKELKLLTESIPQIVFEAAPDGTITYMNEKWKSFTGVDHRDASWGRVLFEDDIPNVQAAWGASLATGDAFNVEYRLRRHDGEYRWVVARALPIKENGGQLSKWFGTLTDIHENKKSEEAALRMASIVESSVDAIISKDLNGIVTSWNRAAEKMFGYSAQEMIGQPVLKLFPEDLAHEENHILSELRGGNTIEHFDTVRVTKSGRPLQVNLSISAILDADKKVVGISKIIRDVTELRRSELELTQLRAQQAMAEVVMESEAKFKGAFEHSPIGVLLLNSEGQWHDVNQAFCKMLGYTKAELIKKELNDLLPAPDREMSAKARSDLFACNISSLSREKSYLHKDGHTIPVWLEGSIIRDNRGNPLYLMAQVIDMTERKLAEGELKETSLRLKTLIDSSPAAILATDDNLMVTLWNPACERIFGWTQSEAVGNYLPYVPIEKRSESSSIVTKVHGSSTPLFFDIERVRKDGSPIQIHSGIMSLHDKLGRPSGLMAVVIDVTDRVQAESAHKDAKLVAEVATRTKSEFLANMSHEIRTPMNGVIGMSGLLLDTTLSSQQLSYVEAIKSSGESLLAIINDILDFSKVEAGKLSLEREDFNIRDSIRGLEEILSIAAHKKGVELHTHVAADVPQLIVGDSGRIRQIATNLVSNALKFTIKGSVKMKVTREVTSNLRQKLRFEVVDSGIGIPLEAQKKLFTSFQQGESSTNRKFGGTGLGLAISKQLVGLMGGEIGFQSTLGMGSTFWFTVDIGVDTAAKSLEALVATPKNQPAPSALPHLSGRVLVAEDNQINQIIALKMLEKIGCRADVVANGSEVLKSLAQIPYDCILMDCQMPEMDGFAATIAIRELERTTGKRIPIIAMTANAMTGDDTKCFDAGMDDYITKPIGIAAFAICIEKWLKNTGNRVA